MQRVYVASSWRNQYQDIVVTFLRGIGHEVYDFKNPAPGERGFSWAEVDPGWNTAPSSRTVDAAMLRSMHQHDRALHGYTRDRDAMEWASACVLVLPCGRSAHLEAGWMVGRGKRLVVYIPAEERIEPDLMYLLGGDCLVGTMHGVAQALRVDP